MKCCDFSKTRRKRGHIMKRRSGCFAFTVFQPKWFWIVNFLWFRFSSLWKCENLVASKTVFYLTFIISTYFLCFRSFSVDKLEDIHRHLDLSIDFPEFSRIYQYATAAPYSFLYVDVRKDQFRKNFNEEIIGN